MKKNLSRKTVKTMLRESGRNFVAGDQNAHKGFSQPLPSRGHVRQNIPLNGILQRIASRLPVEKRESPQKTDRRHKNTYNLTVEQVRQLRAFNTPYGYVKALADKFGISYAYAIKVRRGYVLGDIV